MSEFSIACCGCGADCPTQPKVEEFPEGDVTRVNVTLPRKLEPPWRWTLVPWAGGRRAHMAACSDACEARAAQRAKDGGAQVH